MTPKVSVVMSNYNGVYLKLVEGSLSSLLNNTYPNLEVLLIDNASTDASAEVIKKKFGNNAKLTLLQNPINMYSQGLNLGIRNSSGKYIAFFNNDATVDNGYFEKLVKFMENNKQVALVQGKLLSVKDKSVIDCVGETMDIFGNPKSIGNGEKSQGAYGKQMEILSVTGSCSILRRSVVDDIGYFDNEYGIGYEDMDLALRARMRGYEVMYYPDAYVYHQRGATDLSPIIKTTVKWHFNKNRIMTLLKNFSSEDIAKALPVIILSYIGAGFLEMIVKKNVLLGKTRFTALLWVGVHLPEILEKRRIVQKKKRAKNMKIIYTLMIRDNLLTTVRIFLFGK